MLEIEPNRMSDHCIRQKNIDRDALRVLRRLHDYGFYAYLVGGSVRDLLIGRKPKDFDVVTSAQPREIKRLFRRCRLIGRRFRLAHILGEGGKIIETATFRAKPKNLEHGQIIFDDNQFGTPKSDALRRDFTVNALFYDAHRDEVIDYVNGLTDLEAGLLRTIGDPTTRFEDPVRMLRAVKFAVRLDFEIESETRQPFSMSEQRSGRAATLRELLRLAGGVLVSRRLDCLTNCATRNFNSELAATLSRLSQSERERIDRLFHALDTQMAKIPRMPNGIIIAVLMWPVVEAVIGSLSEPIQNSRLRYLVEELTRPLAIRVCIPRRSWNQPSWFCFRLRFARLVNKKFATIFC